MSQITLNLPSETARKLAGYIKPFGSKELFFEQFSDYHKNRFSREIASMQIDIDAMEQRYNIDSKEFYSRFEAGHLGDDNDFIVWAGIIELQKDIKQKLANL